MLLILYAVAIFQSQSIFCSETVFAVVPKSQDVYAGRNALFQCSLKEAYKGLYTLKWRSDGISLKDDSRRFVGSSGYLQFDPVDKDLDTGEFQCVATSIQPPHQEHVTGRVSLNIKWLNVLNVILRSPSSESDVLPDRRIMLKCNATGSPKPQTKNILWRLNGTIVDDYDLKFNVSKGRLLIEKTKLKIYDGTYSCCLPEEHRRKCSTQPYVLHVRDKSMPIITNYPEDVTVRFGHNATFLCGFDSSPPPRIEWLHDGDLIKQKQMQGCRLCSFGNGTLIVRNVRYRNQGRYTCRAIGNGGGTVSASAELIIAYIKNFSNPSELTYVDKGEAVEKACLPPEAEPHPTISWIRQGQHILPSTGGITGGTTVSGKTLVIQSVHQADEGEYQCVARNMAGNVMKTYHFRIKKKPEIVSSLVARTEREGSDVTLKCLADAAPPPTFTWDQNNTVLKTNGHFVMTGNQLTIKMISVKDAAEYKCTAENEMGFVSSSAYIQVKEWLKFDPMPNELCVEANKSTEISCVARGVKDPVVAWTISTDSPTEKTKITSNGPANKTLILLNPSLGEQWTAHCTANTESSLVDLSPPTHTVKISVGKRPKIVKPPQNSVIFKGQSVRLDCGIAPDLTDLAQLRWRIITNTSALEYSVKTNSDSNKYNVMNNGSFFISNASAADSGTYSCHYKDCGFEVSDQAFLDVAETEGPITTPTDSDNEDPVDGGPQYKKIQTVALAAGCSVAYLILTLTIIVYCRRKKRHKSKTSSLKTAGNAEDLPLMPDGCSIAENGVPGGDQIMLGNLRHLNEEIQHLQYDQSKLDHVTVIGHGEFGEVCLSRAPGIFPDLQDDVLVMVKNFDSNSSDQSNSTAEQRKWLKALRYEFNREIRLLYKADHKNVGRVLGVCTDNTESIANPHCFITEYLEWGILKLCLQASSEGKLQRFSKNAKMRMCCQIAAGLEHLTRIRISHQDVATRNCLISSKLLIKLSVLSLKKEGFESEYALLNGRQMPIRWMAPEILSGGPYEFKSDVWSFGVTCWEIFTLGTLPFSDLSDDQFLEEMDSENPPTLPTLEASKRITSLISKCCQKNQTSRPEFHQIVKKLHSVLGIEPNADHTGNEIGVDVHTRSGSCNGAESLKGTLDAEIVT